MNELVAQAQENNMGYTNMDDKFAIFRCGNNYFFVTHKKPVLYFSGVLDDWAESTTCVMDECTIEKYAKEFPTEHRLSKDECETILEKYGNPLKRECFNKLITKDDIASFTFEQYSKIGTTSLSNEILPMGQKVQTSEGEYKCTEPSRLAIDSNGNVYPVAESIFQKSYKKMQT